MLTPERQDAVLGLEGQLVKTPVDRRFRSNSRKHDLRVGRQIDTVAYARLAE